MKQYEEDLLKLCALTRTMVRQWKTLVDMVNVELAHYQPHSPVTFEYAVLMHNQVARRCCRRENYIKMRDYFVEYESSKEYSQGFNHSKNYHLTVGELLENVLSFVK